MRYLPRVLLLMFTGFLFVGVNADPTGEDRNAAARNLDMAGLMGPNGAVPHYQDLADDISDVRRILPSAQGMRDSVVSARRWAEAKFTRPPSRPGFGENARGGWREFGASTGSGLP
jgi:hypothetical protein